MCTITSKLLWFCTTEARRSRVPSQLWLLSCDGSACNKIELNATLVLLFCRLWILHVLTCVRDDDGAFVLAKTVSFYLICPVSVGEALGLFYALEWLSDTQMDNIDFVVDYKTTKIILECKRHFTSHFTNYCERDSKLEKLKLWNLSHRSTVELHRSTMVFVLFGTLVLEKS